MKLRKIFCIFSNCLWEQELHICCNQVFYLDNLSVCKGPNFGSYTSYYLLIDSDILETVIQTIGRCPIDNCSGKVKSKNKFSKKMGLSCNLELSCAICVEDQHFHWQKNPNIQSF